MEISHTSDDSPDDERDPANFSQCRRESRFRKGNLPIFRSALSIRGCQLTC